MAAGCERAQLTAAPRQSSSTFGDRSTGEHFSDSASALRLVVSPSPGTKYFREDQFCLRQKSQNSLTLSAAALCAVPVSHPRECFTSSLHLISSFEVLCCSLLCVRFHSVFILRGGVFESKLTTLKFTGPTWFLGLARGPPRRSRLQHLSAPPTLLRALTAVFPHRSTRAPLPSCVSALKTALSAVLPFTFSLSVLGSSRLFGQASRIPGTSEGRQTTFSGLSCQNGSKSGSKWFQMDPSWSRISEGSFQVPPTHP